MNKYAESRKKLESLYEYATVCDGCNKQTIGDQLELLQMSGNLDTKVYSSCSVKICFFYYSVCKKFFLAIQFKQLSEKSTELEKLKIKFSLAYNQTRKKLDDLHALFFSTSNHLKVFTL